MTLTTVPFTDFDFASRRDALCCDWGQGWYSAALDGREIFRGDSGFQYKAEHSFRVTGESSASICSEDHSMVSVELTTDDWPLDTSWELFDQHGNLIRQETNFKEAYNTYVFETEMCIATDQCSTFYIFDAFGDGLTGGNGGEYKIFLDGELIHSGSDFGRGENKVICPSEMSP